MVCQEHNVRVKVVPRAELAQSVERTTLNRVVVGSIPTFGAFELLGDCPRR